MKLLVFDYDDTLFVDEDQTLKNVETINMLDKKKVLVAVATGRAFNDIFSKKNKYNINIDYYICSNGTYILDSKGNIICDEKIVDDGVFEIESIIEKNMDIIKDYEVSNGVDYYENKILPGETSNFYIEPKDCITIETVMEKLENIKNINVFRCKQYVHITPENISKASVIEIVEKREKINKIYVIGDSGNDVEMVKKYNGSCVVNSTEELKNVSKNIYQSVEEYIKKEVLLENAYE